MFVGRIGEADSFIERLLNKTIKLEDFRDPAYRRVSYERLS